MESTTQLLCRSDIPDIDPDLLVDKNVLTYAEEKIGYKHPERDRKLAKGELSTALRMIGTKPFTPESVKSYQAAEVSKSGLTGVWIEIGRWTRNLSPVLYFLLLVGGLGSLIEFAQLAQAGTPFSVLHFVHWYMVSLVTGLLGAVLHRYLDQRQQYDAVWRTVELKDYKGPVPEFALATAVELHQRVPQAKLFIEELVITKRERQPFVNDPFLKVTLDDEVHYLEVWKEPGYKQERMA